MKEEDLIKAENYLNRFGYKDLIFKKVEYGINSSSWKVSSENQKYFLKFYKNLIMIKEIELVLNQDLRPIKEGGLKIFQIYF